jgi:hypothetical protein
MDGLPFQLFLCCTVRICLRCLGRWNVAPFSRLGSGQLTGVTGALTERVFIHVGSSVPFVVIEPLLLKISVTDKGDLHVVCT